MREKANRIHELIDLDRLESEFEFIFDQLRYKYRAELKRYQEEMEEYEGQVQIRDEKNKHDDKNYDECEFEPEEPDCYISDEGYELTIDLLKRRELMIPTAPQLWEYPYINISHDIDIDESTYDFYPILKGVVFSAEEDETDSITFILQSAIEGGNEKSYKEVTITDDGKISVEWS